ncbi:hypothetical protein [Actinoplanes couchii]|uniref:Uncharacterized protein n=1 Tax=Actinoplanes couchii TaxID=403638 RepID=A0ABQ3XEE9_9ACTN|nr:hypothetical protein [Actinoplanes couchii]MDR6319736.1 hypothetical protein [Actinoplanes couchii]GID56870.1 hypothetical protein Aco03nite_052740 [Actinoplanes couchii]
MPDESWSPFAGDLFLTLARRGCLTVEPARAQEILAGLEKTLSVVRARHEILCRRQPSGPRADELPEEPAGAVTDAVFVEQVAPGLTEKALAELPKYIESIRRAAEPSRTPSVSEERREIS